MSLKLPPHLLIFHKPMVLEGSQLSSSIYLHLREDITPRAPGLISDPI